uniref:CBF1-interacting co-repressor CIR N-terminal domain-containing protein n=1 Tax=Oryza punctata TaxID=4537 RepID=A0A0E0LFI0_ORYPU
MEEEVTGSRGGFGGGKKMAAGEVELKEKAGTAWSHSYLNQKPWHPLSYPNQRRKWIAEQIHANRARRQEEVQREFAQEQEFFRQTALFSKKDKEKMEVMKAVSFMYVRPPGYNAESAKAAEIEDEKRRSGQGDATQSAAAASTSSMPDKELDKTHAGPDKKNRPKDVFGRPLPTEQEFEVLKNAPRLETGAPARVKPFGVEVRNVRCLRCGNYGHQSGDRECPLKDVIMPNEESRLKRDDPLTAIMAQTDSSEPLKWELRQKPGMSPPRGGYNPDDPNQQIVAEDIFDEYGGFLGGCDIPALLSNFSASKSKKRSKSRSKHRQAEPAAHEESSHSEAEKSNRTSRSKREKEYCSDSSFSGAEVEARKSKQKSKHKKKHLLESSSDSKVEVDRDTRRHQKREHRKKKRNITESESSSDSEVDIDTRRHSKREHRKKKRNVTESDSEVEVDRDTRRHPKREHRKEKRNMTENAPSSFSKDKGDMARKGHSSRSREKHHYSDTSSSESEKHSMRYKDKQYYSDSSSRSNRHSRRSREKRDRHSKRLRDKRDYTESRPYESNKHSRISKVNRHYSDSSASDYSYSERHYSHRHLD